ncbi:hypothetical protein GCM10017607_21370 [Microbacterium thalassium]|nr:hypothetical protein GCM10017607_21370 [Microbacterium thalassium]
MHRRRVTRKDLGRGQQNTISETPTQEWDPHVRVPAGGGGAGASLRFDIRTAVQQHQRSW